MRVGFIGLGNVGGKLASSLLRNGFELMVNDLQPSAAGSLLEGGAQWGGKRGGSRAVQRRGRYLSALPPGLCRGA